MRRAVRVVALSALLGLVSAAPPPVATSLGTVSAQKARTLSVTSFGAKGDGRTDDTDAIQAGVDALRPGDTLFFPEGVYSIRTDKGVELKDGVRLDLGRATLTGANVRGARCRLLFIEGARNIVITGGTLIGSRSGAPEWAIGILASDADDLRIENVTLRDFYFDGILLTGNRGCRRVRIRRCVSENNRRTGLAIVSAADVTVEDSTFRNSRGQSPEAGVNCEPGPGASVTGVRFSRCTFADNAGVGLYIHRALGVDTSNATVESSQVENNNQGIVMSGVDTGLIEGCRVAGHRIRGKSGIALGDGTRNVTVRRNRLEDNLRSIMAAGATGVRIDGNTVVGTGPPFAVGRGDDGDGIVCRGLKSLLADACVITDNVIRGTVGSGIVTQLVSRVEVTDNVVEDTGQRGVHLLSTTRSEVKGNRVSAHGLESPARYAAIELANSSNDNLVANNQFRNAGYKQLTVAIGPGCSGNKEFGNVTVSVPSSPDPQPTIVGE